MSWEIGEALEYYGKQGAPSDQMTLVNLLKEMEKECGGISRTMVQETADYYKIKESLLLALIKRYPSLHLKDSHCLEICCGSNCPKRADLAGFAEKTYGKHPSGFELKLVPCMRMCGKGPNIKWDGQIFHGADEALIRRLVEGK